jgi:L,D-transpeptidase ErfK/SrfK
MRIIFSTALFCLFLTCPGGSWSWYPRLQSQSLLDQTQPGDLVGQHRSYLLGPDETLIELARRSGIGYLALLRANPGIDPWLPPAGQKILLPYAFLLPQSAQEGITINLAELRLYYRWRERGQQRVRAYPVGIGSEGWDTPEGDFSIAQHIKHPSWTAPATILAAEPGTATSMPPGPENPLGEYWLGLSIPGYGIHGTNKPFGVGRRVSHGCLRLYPEDIRDLFPRAIKGTPVRIIYQPIKVGLHNGQLFAEIHQDLYQRMTDPVAEVLRQVAALSWQGEIDFQALSKAIAAQRGIPVLISQN